MSYSYLRNARKRLAFLDPTGALEHAGGVRDRPAGYRKYADYLDPIF